jgi:hypothetical protein
MPVVNIIGSMPMQRLALEILFSGRIRFEYPIYCFAPQVEGQPRVPLTGQDLTDFIQAYADNEENQYRLLNPQIINSRTEGPTSVVVIGSDVEQSLYTVRIEFDVEYRFATSHQTEKTGEELDAELQAFAEQYEAQYRQNTPALLPVE